MKGLLLSSIALLGAVSLSSTALAADPAAAAKEMATAATHARLAEASQSLEVTDMHLHHTINCLVGPHGKRFDAKAGNPCHGMGDGALRDSRARSEVYSKARRALDEALRALDARDLSAAHAAASEVAQILK